MRRKETMGVERVDYGSEDEYQGALQQELFEQQRYQEEQDAMAAEAEHQAEMNAEGEAAAQQAEY